MSLGKLSFDVFARSVHRMSSRIASFTFIAPPRSCDQSVYTLFYLLYSLCEDWPGRSKPPFQFLIAGWRAFRPGHFGTQAAAQQKITKTSIQFWRQNKAQTLFIFASILSLVYIIFLCEISFENIQNFWYQQFLASFGSEFLVECLSVVVN